MTVIVGMTRANGIKTIDHLRKAIEGLDGQIPVSPSVKMRLFESVEPGEDYVEILTEEDCEEACNER